MSIDFIDLKAQQGRIRPLIDAAIAKVLDHGGYIMGAEVREFEKQLAAFGGAAHALSCANGTDAVALPLMAWDVGKGDAVFCPSFTFAATAEVVPWTDATPVFIDILPDTYNMDPAHLEAAIAQVKREGNLVPKVVIAVDLFGQPADYPKIAQIARRYGLKLIADSAQGFGCTLDGQHPLHWADATATSFFPAKPLGCYGDGGAVLTNDAELFKVMDSLRVHGKGTDKYDNVRIGMNSRLDTLQAAILIEKLAIFPDEIEARNRVATRYSEKLSAYVSTPAVIAGGVSTWAQILIETDDRDGLSAHLKAKGVPFAVYYPKPVHAQSAYQDFPVGGNGLPVSDAKSRRVISLPMHPYLDEATQDVIIAAVAGIRGPLMTAPAQTAGQFAAIAERFIEAAQVRTLTIGILGLGYVGLPLAEAFIKVGFPVMGFDIAESKVQALADGKTYIRHITDERIAAMNATGRFKTTTDFSRLHEADALLICVPTPLTAHRDPDLSYVVNTAELIAETLRPGQLVVLESTTYPGTTEEVILPILERGGLKAGVDFAAAYSPEREDPGNPDFSTTSIPKVVGANTDAERRMALAIYDSFTKTVPVSDLKTAEAVKLTENIFRLVNIGMVNELKAVFAGMDIDVWEVIEAAKTKPFGYMAFYPGPGLGGHCIPIDPFYLTWKARAYGLSTRMIDIAGDITTALPRGVVEKTAESLDDRLGKSLSQSKVLIVGIAYKKNIDDLRESPALPIIEQLLRRGAEVSYHDPHVPEATAAAYEHPEIAKMRSIAWTPEGLNGFDCAIIVTDHDDIHYETLLQSAPLVIDTRNATAKLAHRYPGKIVKA